MLRDLKFLRYWWSCLACVTLCWFALHETLILLSCCVFIEMVNCLNTIILKSFLIIVFTSILHLFYRTIIPPTICTTHIFFINRILDPITSDVISPYTFSKFTQIFTWAMAFYSASTKTSWLRYKKNKQNPFKISFCFQTGDKIVSYVSTRGHWDCTTLQHHCTTFGFASGYTEVLQGGTISMPTDRHVDNL